MQSPMPVPGARVWIRQRQWRVDRAQLDRGVMRLDVSCRRGRLTVLAPFDRPAFVDRAVRPVRVRPQHARARLAHLIATTHAADGAPAARDAHIALLPHQLEPLLAVLAGTRRVLVADEVGLGKTIQAGLILAELMRQSPHLRALLVVPAGLRDQWAGELEARFAIRTVPADQAALDALGRTTVRGENVWRGAGVWLASPDFLKQRHVRDGLPLAAWDLVVVDEVHAAAGRSDRHDVCDEMARRAACVVLLSATPHTGDPARFDRLLRLGALPDRHDRLAVFRRTRAEIRRGARRAVRWHRIRPSRAARHLLDTIVAFEQVVLRTAPVARHDGARLLLAVFRKRALSTLQALDRSLARRLEFLDAPDRAYAFDWVQPRLAFEDGDDDLADSERAALLADSGVPAATERVWIRRLRALTERARADDRKLTRLAALVKRCAEPVVIFTEFRHSLDAVRARLGTMRPVAVLHGGLTPAERRLEIRRFGEGAASVLLATDVGGQGLNLHARARWVVSVELPWMPARLEQRIGRVDRIGQSRPVHATVLLLDHAADLALQAIVVHRAAAADRALDGRAVTLAAPPGDAALTGALLEGSPLEASVQPPAVARTLGWRRRARALARHLTGQRALGTWWRGPETAGARPAWTHHTALPRIAHLASAALAVFTLPILDGSGRTVETHAVAVRIDAARTADLRSALPHAERTAAAALAARLRRARRRAADVSLRRIETERLIGAHLRALQYPEEAQLGLFSQGEARAFDAQRRAAHDLAGAEGDRVRVARDAARIEVGRPALELLLDARS